MELASQIQISKLLRMDEGAFVAMKKCLRLPKSQNNLMA